MGSSGVVRGAGESTGITSISSAASMVITGVLLVSADYTGMAVLAVSPAALLATSVSKSYSYISSPDRYAVVSLPASYSGDLDLLSSYVPPALMYKIFSIRVWETKSHWFIPY